VDCTKSKTGRLKPKTLLYLTLKPNENKERSILNATNDWNDAGKTTSNCCIVGI